MIAKLVEDLICQDAIITSMGGRSKTDHAVKEIFFLHAPEDDKTDSSQSSLEKTEPSPKRLKKEVIKCLVPDVVAERTEDFGLHIGSELLNVSVKSGAFVKDRDHDQLKYELLPVALKEGAALGLLICASQAYLYRLVLADNCYTFKRRNYEFGDGTLVESFSQICKDIVYYAEQQRLLSTP